MAKPPTFGQKKLPDPTTYTGIGGRSIALGDLGLLTQNDVALLQANSNQQYVNAARALLNPFQMGDFQRWAVSNPTMDPRAYWPLASGGVDPFSDQGKAIAKASNAATVNTGAFDLPTNSPVTPSASPQTVATAPGGTFGQPVSPFPQPQDGPVAPQTGGGPLTDVLNSVGGMVKQGWDSTSSTAATGIRAAQYALQTPYDAGQAVLRTNIGEAAKQMEIAKSMGLSRQEALVAFPNIDAQTQTLAGKDLYATAAGAGTPDMPNEAVDNRNFFQKAVGIVQDAMNAQSGNAPVGLSYDTLPDERKAIVDQARAAWTKQAGSVGDYLSTIKDQTPAGVIGNDPTLLTNDKGLLASNPNVAAKTENASVTTYDMRTPEEVAKGIQPIGWTPGRGVAGLYYSPDEQAFHTMSGILDFGVNLTSDPVNLIPLNAPEKATKGLASGTAKLVDALGGDASRVPYAIDRGMQIGGKKVAVQTSLPRFGSTGSGYMAAREAARGKDVVDALKIDMKVADPDVLARAAAKDAKEGIPAAYSTRVTPEGTVTTPHGNFVANKAAWDFLNSGRGNALVNDLVNETSTATIWARSGRKMDVDLAESLAKASSPEEVRAILGTRLGMDLADPASLRNFGSMAPPIFKNQALNDHPLWNWLRKAPQQVAIDLEDRDQTITQLERFARGARMPWEAIQPHLDNIMAAKDSVDRYKTIYGDSETGAGGLMDAVAKHLVNDVGISEARAKQVTRAFEGGLDPSQRNHVNAGIADVFGAGDDGSVGSAMLTSEFLNRAAVLPDYRTIRQLGSAVANLERKLGGSSMRESDAALAIRRKVNEATTIWKSAVLVRPAYVAREVGEMLFSSSLAGYDSAITHPARFASLVFGAMAQKDATSLYGRVAKAAQTGLIPASVEDKIAMKVGVSQATGDTMQKIGARAYQAGASALYGTAAAPKAFLDQSGATALMDWLHHRQGLSELVPSMSQSWARVNGDPLLGALNDALRGGSDPIPTLYDGLNAGAEMNLMIDQRLGGTAKHGIGVASRDDIATHDAYINGLIDKIAKMSRDPDMRNIANPEMDPAQVLQHFRASGSRDLKAKAQPTHFAGRTDQDYLDGYRKVLSTITGNDEDLVKAVLDGNFSGVPLTRKNSGLRQHIADMLTDDTRKTSLPESVRYDKADFSGEIRNYLDEKINQFFMATGEVSDLFARVPMFREAYANHVEHLAPEMSPAAKATIVANLRNAGDVKLARRVQNLKANGTLGVEDIDHIAGNYARSEMKRIFYNAHEQQNYAVALRAIMPFAQATFNTFRRWGEFSLRNPQLMYRTVKPLVNGQSSDSASIYGALGSLYGDPSNALYDPSTYSYSSPDTRAASGQGFFFTDQYGDQKFAYPMIGPLGQFFGIPGGALPTSSLSGLNVAGTTLQPGAGWLLTLPASMMSAPQEWLTDKGFVGDSMRFMFPYGLPQGTPADKLLQAFSPSWFAKMSKASDEVSALPNMTTKIMPVVMANGKYDLSSTADQNRLVNDSTNVATRLWIWNAIMGSITPSSINTTVAVPEAPTSQPAVGTDVLSNPEKSKIVNAMAASGPEGPEAATRFILQDLLHQEWNKYTSAPGADGYRNGMLAFVHDYGPAALMSVLPRSTGTNQATNDLWQFRTDHKDTYNSFNQVIGLFFAGASGGTTGTGTTDYADPLYAAQKASGERTVTDPEVFLHNALNQWGWMIWNPKATEIETSNMSPAEQSAAKADVAEQITKLTGGYWSRNPTHPDQTARQLEQVQQALLDPTMQTLGSAKYVGEYMNERDKVLAQAKARGTGQSLTSQQNADLAQHLVDYAISLNKQDPTGGFSNMWHRLLVNELGG